MQMIPIFGAYVGAAKLESLDVNAALEYVKTLDDITKYHINSPLINLTIQFKFIYNNLYSINNYYSNSIVLGGFEVTS